MSGNLSVPSDFLFVCPPTNLSVHLSQLSQLDRLSYYPVSPFIHLFVHLYVSSGPTVCLSLSPSSCLSLNPFACLSVYPPKCLFVLCLFIHLSFSLSAHSSIPFVCRSSCASINLSICLSVCMFVCLWDTIKITWYLSLSGFHVSPLRYSIQVWTVSGELSEVSLMCFRASS